MSTTTEHDREEFMKFCRLIQLDAWKDMARVLASSEPDTSAIAEQHLLGFLAGYRAGIRELEAHIAECLGTPRS